MKLPKPKDELIAEICFALGRGLKPIHMVLWTREWLQSLDDKALLRCWLETAEMRLNPTNSTNFAEEGINPAERHARIIEFVSTVPSSKLMSLAVEAIEKTFLIADLADSHSESASSWRAISGTVLQAWQQDGDRRRQAHAKGGKNKAANAVPNPEIALAREYKNRHPDASSEQIKMRLKLKAAPRTIRLWINGKRGESAT